MYNPLQEVEGELSSLSSEFIECDGNHLPVTYEQEGSAVPVIVCGKGQLHFFNYCPECIQGDKESGFTVLTIPEILQEFAKLKNPHNETTACQCNATKQRDND